MSSNNEYAYKSISPLPKIIYFVCIGTAEELASDLQVLMDNCDNDSMTMEDARVEVGALIRKKFKRELEAADG